MNLEIILRTHDQSNVHTYEERFCGFDKQTLILGCVTSLVNSANLVENHSINFKILDDHSSEDFIQKLYKILDHSKWPYELYRMSEPGFNHSALKQFEYCRDSEADLVYSVEDDYLHCPSAITEMFDNHDLFTRLSGQEIVLYPFDFPDDYRPEPSGPCMIVYGTKRHWRTGMWTTNTFFLRPELVRQHWHLFEKLATEYNPDYSLPEPHVHEGNTICEIWKNYSLRFSPIPSLALHMQFERQKDPYIDWQKWWNEYTILK
jgi:hypothetical protein